VTLRFWSERSYLIQIIELAAGRGRRHGNYQTNRVNALSRTGASGAGGRRGASHVPAIGQGAGVGMVKRRPGPCP